MNLGDIKEDVWGFLAQTASKGTLTADELTRQANKGQWKVATLILSQQQAFFETESTLSETSGTAAVNLPVNVYSVSHLNRLLDSGGGAYSRPYPLRRIPNASEAIEAALYPATFPIATPDNSQSWCYYQRGRRQIVLVPTPTYTVANSLQLVYHYRCAEMTQDAHEPFLAAAGQAGSGDDSLIEWHDLIVLYVLRWALAKDESMSQLQEIEAQWQERISDLMTFLRVNVDTPQEIIVPPEEADFFDTYG